MMGAEYEWKPSPVFPDCYLVSKCGKVLSKERNILCRNGAIMRVRQKMLKPAIVRGGYEIVKLCFMTESQDVLVHRLVATLFCDARGKDLTILEVNHIDGNKLNNHASNLEWVTPKENMKHAVESGLHWSCSGESHGQAKLKDQDVLKMKSMRKGGMTYKAISLVFNVNEVTARYAIIGHTWRHLKDA